MKMKIIIKRYMVEAVILGIVLSVSLLLIATS